jgi:hypothetical protein
MKPLRKFLLILLFILLSGFISVFLYHFLSPERSKPLHSNGFIQLPNDFDIHFTKEGFSISFPHTVFYSPEGIEVEPPFAAEDFINLPLGFSITRSTDNYLLINERYIFSTTETPYKMIWQSDNKIIRDIIEVEDSLLLVLKDQDDFLIPHMLDPNTNELTNLQGLIGSYFIEAATCDESGSVSILAFSDDGLFPSARVFHYDSKGTLYGALTLKDSLYFSISRMQSSFVLVGSNRVICYNTDGDRNWALDIPNAYRHSKVFSGDYLWLYFTFSSTGFSNAMRIGKDSSKEWFNLPHGLSSLQSYSDGLIGVLNHNEIVVFNSSGELTARFEPGIDIDKMYWSKDLPGYIYIIDRYGRLSTHTFFEPTNEEDS